MKIVKIKLLNFETLIFVIFILSIVLNANTYFTWESYGNTLINYLIKGFRYFGLLITLFYIEYKGMLSNHITKKIFLLGVVLLIAFVEMNYLGASFVRLLNIGSLITFLTFIICFSLSFKQRSKLYEIFMILFIILTLPSVIYFLLVYLVGVPLPYSVLASDHPLKAAAGIYYELRPLGLILTSTGFSIPRLCGIFDEPGVIGTLAAFLVAINVNCSKYKKWTYLLIFEGIVSFSMAFYALMIILYMVIAFNKNRFRFIALSATLLISLSVFINMEFDNAQIKRIQQRIDFTSGILIKDNRTSDTFDKAFEDFVSRGGYSFYFGEGLGAYSENPNMAGSNSYKCIIYNHGIIGFILYIGFFVLVYAMEYGLNKYNLPFFVVFMASIYQRFGVLNPMYLILFTTGLAYIAIFKDEMKYLNKKTKDHGEKHANHQICVPTSR